jgi:DNA-binding MarR family transcriptional regulator
MISNKLSRGSSRLYIRKFGIGVIEWRILGFLKSNGSASAKNICQTLAIDKSAASRSIQELESKQLISVSPIDRRQRALSLTNKGRSPTRLGSSCRVGERTYFAVLARRERARAITSPASQTQGLHYCNQCRAQPDGLGCSKTEKTDENRQCKNQQKSGELRSECLIRERN